jgi:predicted metal-binding protein
MDKNERELMIHFMKEKCNDADGVFINPKELVFEENVKMNCYYCGKYNNNWRCPPNLPNIDYPKMMEEYTDGLFVVLKYNIASTQDYDYVRNESSVVLHRLLLTLEKWMWNHNNSNAISFGGGSCKLCKGGCGKEKCNIPYMSRSPLEATGVNVVKSARKYGINIEFPTDKQLMRIGLLLWQEQVGYDMD